MKYKFKDYLIIAGAWALEITIILSFVTLIATVACIAGGGVT